MRIASLATALAMVGVGVALVRRPRTRRTSGGEADDRRARTSLRVGEPSAAGLQRVAIGQLDLAIALLESYPGESGEHTVHETRKALKRVRAIVRVLRDELDDERFARAGKELGDCARQLAGARDATVMLQALDGLLERRPKLAGRRVLELRAQLARERDAASVAGGVPAAVAAELWTVRARIAARDLGGRRRESPELLAGGLERLYRKGRRRMRRARRRRRDITAAHAWRKSVKDLRYVAETLDRAGAANAPKHRKRLRRAARRADRLGEMLGEEHDLALLEQLVRRQAERSQGAERSTGRKQSHRALLEAIEDRRRRLRRRALREGERLYGRRPRRFVRGVRRAL